MIQSFDVQLQVALRSLQEIVFPALDGAEKHVVEQLMITIGTLGFIKTRLPEARRYFRMELKQWVALAKDAAEIADAREVMLGTIGAGEKALDDPEADIADFEAVSRRLGEEITALSHASIGEPYHSHLDALILARGAERIKQQRLWCAPFGFELQPETLPEPAW